MMIETRPGSSFKPFAKCVGEHAVSADVLRLMEDHNAPFVAVVDSTGAFVGLVYRGVLEVACASNGHVPHECVVIQHLKRDIPRRNEDGEPLPALAEPRRRVRRQPQRRAGDRVVVVVDRASAPLGYVDLAEEE